MNTADTFAKLPNWLCRRPDVSATAKLLYARLHQYQGDNATAWPGIGTLAAEIGVHRSRVIEHLKALEHLKLIRIERTFGRGNQYELLSHRWMNTSSGNTASSENGTGSESATETGSGNGTTPVAETLSKEINKRSRKRSSTSRRTSAPWTKPELPELEAYAQEIGLPVTEIPAFVDHYNSNGWKIGGRSPMKDWQAALRNWKRNHDKWGASKTHATTNRNTNTFNEGHVNDYAKAAR